MASSLSSELPHVIHGWISPFCTEYGYGPEVCQPPTAAFQVCQSSTARLESNHIGPIRPIEPGRAQQVARPRQQTFWRHPKLWLLLVVIVIIGASIGDGVGGSLAVQKAKSKFEPSSSPVLARIVPTSVDPSVRCLPTPSATFPPMAPFTHHQTLRTTFV
ncbi:hypothetical protein IQ06DRAFT_298084 [Phaeosphaeriaceae sp. SRC1lsM3a]|nr:hypothetical protein IQ06DRAFT_298084 [Stagonospora sp. SRC1lsM3a]